MKNIRTKDIINVLENQFFRKFGVPTQILTDQGQNFISNEAHQFYKKYNITKTGNNCI